MSKRTKKSPGRRRGNKSAKTFVERWPFKSDSACFNPSVAHLSEEERALVAAVNEWVEFGREPSGELWEQARAPVRGPLIEAYAKTDEYVAMRHPRALLARFDQRFRMELRVALVLSLAKFVSEPVHVLQCVAFAARYSPVRAEVLATFLPTDVPELVREYARLVLLALSNPGVFPDMFRDNDMNALRQYRSRFLFVDDSFEALFPFETWLLYEVTDEQLATPMFDIQTSEAQERLLSWLLNSPIVSMGMGDTDGVPQRPYCTLLRRVLDMTLRSGLRPAGEQVWQVVLSPTLVTALRVCSPEVQQEIQQIVAEVLRRPEVTAAGLGDIVRRLLLNYKGHVHEGVVAMARILVSCGAPTLLRDEAGFLLITNVRAGVVFIQAGASCGRNNYFVAGQVYMADWNEKETGQRLEFYSQEVHRDLLDVISARGAGWTRHVRGGCVFFASETLHRVTTCFRKSFADACSRCC